MTGSSLAACPTAKCLTVYVAPWCGYCRRATPIIVELQRRLPKDAATLRVVVGMDSMEAVRQYAREFGPDTLLDPEGSFRMNGVPQFLVSDASGRLVKKVPGMPDVESAAEMAELLGLPYENTP
ncbi:MAG: TlpA family protein disulfide reductase [Elusimicrobia bacterium]|nr:TlpA family protein disulfide reductase [Elusimicrobiota bacterium]